MELSYYMSTSRVDRGRLAVASADRVFRPRINRRGIKNGGGFDMPNMCGSVHSRGGNSRPGRGEIGECGHDRVHSIDYSINRGVSEQWMQARTRGYPPKPGMEDDDFFPVSNAFKTITEEAYRTLLNAKEDPFHWDFTSGIKACGETLNKKNFIRSRSLPIIQNVWYLTNTDYSLWQVILNGDGPIQVTTDEKGIKTEVPPKTAQALLQRQRERKAKSILLLAIPDEYQPRFHGIKDAKSRWAAIMSRFGGKVESKKMQKTILKQQFENFSVSNTENFSYGLKQWMPTPNRGYPLTPGMEDDFFPVSNAFKTITEEAYCTLLNAKEDPFHWDFTSGIKACGETLNKKKFIRSRSLPIIQNVWSETPQQNGVAERKNRTLIEAARTMLADSILLTFFWAEAVNTACYILNRVLVTKPHNKTPYELIIGQPPSISFMRPFRCPVTILNTLDPLGKFDGKAEEGFLVGYSVNSKAFWSSDETDEDDTADDAAGEKPVQKPASENQQTLKNVLDKMMDQEKEAKEQSDTVRKEFEA
ncbi:retrovirus-related pol polyprotein from transposon TNT 1-94 [Tanacetum coccineum]